jgi:hypothetical protein
MQVKHGRKRFFLSLLVCGLCLPVPAVGAGVTIQNVAVDGQARSLSAVGRDRNPLRVSSTARSVRFQFTSDVPAGGAAVRLRYKLEGHDDTWRDLPLWKGACVSAGVLGKVAGPAQSLAISRASASSLKVVTAVTGPSLRRRVGLGQLPHSGNGRPARRIHAWTGVMPAIGVNRCSSKRRTSRPLSG